VHEIDSGSDCSFREDVPTINVGPFDQVSDNQFGPKEVAKPSVDEGNQDGDANEDLLANSSLPIVHNDREVESNY